MQTAATKCFRCPERKSPSRAGSFFRVKKKSYLKFFWPCIIAWAAVTTSDWEPEGLEGKNFVHCRKESSCSGSKPLCLVVGLWLIPLHPPELYVIPNSHLVYKIFCLRGFLTFMKIIFFSKMLSPSTYLQSSHPACIKSSIKNSSPVLAAHLCPPRPHLCTGTALGQGTPHLNLSKTKTNNLK